MHTNGEPHSHMQIIRLIVWALERSIDLTLGACAVVWVLGPFSLTAVPGLLGQFYLGLALTLGFYMMSGFIVSTVLFRFFIQPDFYPKRIILMPALLLGHYLVFELSAVEPFRQTIPLAFLGAAIVFLSTAIGEFLIYCFDRRGSRRSNT